MLTSFWKCDKKTKFASYAIKFASHAKKYMKYGYFFIKSWYFLRKKFKITKYCVLRKKRFIKVHILLVISDKKILRFFKKRHNFRREKISLLFVLNGFKLLDFRPSKQNSTSFSSMWSASFICIFYISKKFNYDKGNLCPWSPVAPNTWKSIIIDIKH